MTIHHRFFAIPQAALADKRLTPAARTVLAYFNSWWSATGDCFPSIARIARETYLHPRTVNHAIRLLVRHKYVTRIPQNGPDGLQCSNIYQPGPQFHPILEAGQMATPGQMATLLEHHNRSGLAPHTDEFFDEDDRLKTLGPPS